MHRISGPAEQPAISVKSCSGKIFGWI